ncbi:MAG: hypothetical protein KDA78_00310 [Planctomycetaceae bacterium]|nr:hypothetical protein [Planctomycetaceae bacterium]
MLHPKLVSQVDAPVLEAWLQAVAFRLGRVEVVSPGTLIASEDREETSAAVQFSKGTATVSLVSIQSQIVSFEVQSESMTNWFSRPTSLKIYRERVEQFIQSLLNEEDSTCLELLHPEVAEKLSPSQLGTYRSSLQTSAGQITATQFHHANLTIQEDERLSQMELIYQLTGSKRTVEASFVIRFRGMRGEIVGFQVR